MVGSNWTDEELEFFAVILVAGSAAIAARGYCRTYLFRNPPRSADYDRARIIDGIIRARETDCVLQLRMKKTTFFNLCSILRDKGLLADAKHVSMEEQLVMFLHTLSHNVRNRVIGHHFIRSGETVSRYFNRVLDAVVSLYGDYVTLPTIETAVEISSNPHWAQYFQDCIGAIDGTHIPAFVPSADSAVYRNRKGFISQNVMAACKFDMKFVYVLPGWEGSASDARVLQSALTYSNDPFVIPAGKYYVVDAGYAHSPGFMAPYRGVRYHLNEYRTGRKPSNARELFNYRHAQLRNVIERCFGVLKARFPMLKTAPQYPVQTQVKIMLACCVLHNFIIISGDDDMFEGEGLSSCDAPDVTPSPTEVSVLDESRVLLNVTLQERNEWAGKRDEIASRMWNEAHPIEVDQSGAMSSNRRSGLSTPTKNHPGSPSSIPRRSPRKHTLNCGIEEQSHGGVLRWMDDMDNILIDGLIELVVSGRRSGADFKIESFTGIAENMMMKLDLKVTNANVKNRIRTVKKNFFTVKDLRSASGFGWDPDLLIVVASDEVWMDYIKSHPDPAQFRGKPMPKFDDLAFIFGNDRATGKSCATGHFPHCATTPRVGDMDVSSDYIVDLNDDINIISSEDLGDDAPHVHWSDNSRGGTNIPHLSPTQHANASGNTTSTVNSKKRPRGERPIDMIGTGIVDIGGVMKSIAISIDKDKNFDRMTLIIPALEELEGLTNDEVLWATKLLSKEEAYGASFLNFAKEKRLSFVRMLLNGGGPQMAKEKYYVVLVGRRPGIYLTWDEARLEVEGFSGSRHRAFKNWREAVSYWESYFSGKSAQLRPATGTSTFQVAGYSDTVDIHGYSTPLNIHQTTDSMVLRATTDDPVSSSGESFCGLLIAILVVLFALFIIIKF